MKKVKWLMLLCLLLFPSANVFGETLNEYTKESLTQLGYTPYNDVTSAMVVDVQTGDVYFAHNENRVVDPASITKLMTAYLVYEAVANQSVSWDTKVTATANDAAISRLPELSNTTIIEGETYTLQDLMYMHLMSSSNVASVMMANLLSHNDLSAFVGQMNRTGQQLGLRHTTYTNPSGAVTADFSGLIQISGYPANQPSYSTAYDVAKLTVELLKKFPEIVNITQLTQVSVGKHTAYPETLTSTNVTLPGMPLGYAGVTGLKTGTSGESGYSFVASANRGDMQLVAVVLGVGRYGDGLGNMDRFYYTNALLDKTYRTYSKKVVIAAGEYMVNDTEIRVESPYEAVVSQQGVSQNYRLENDALVIQRPFQNLYGKTEDTIPVTNVTKLKQEEARRQQEQLLLGIVIVVLVVFVVGVLWRKLNGRQARNKRRYK
ncbi:D-alanyl-D-alanine carboxypeptidase [Carnobacteriaceae bacterium zg-ZUI240]|nr:D-alanyl-D-alanine carboxypeptidase [Carnobacteriaceae bacterium zg-ZUI240]